MMLVLLLLVCVVVCKGIDTINAADSSIDERNLAHLSTHHELASLYESGDPSITRRRLTHTPTRKPTTQKKPTTTKPKPTNSFTQKPSSTTTKPKPTPTRKPTTQNVPTRKPTNKSPTTTGGSIISPGAMFKDDASGMVYVINTNTQYTTYTSDGTCTTWPYQALGNIYITASKTYKLSKTGNRIDGIDMSNSKLKSTFTILNSNPFANKCINSKSSFNTFSNVLDTLRQGDKYRNDDDDQSFW